VLQTDLWVERHRKRRGSRHTPDTSTGRSEADAPLSNMLSINGAKPSRCTRRTRSRAGTAGEFVDRSLMAGDSMARRGRGRRPLGRLLPSQ
jgi:hypothetical protein